jgi:hypothetical protein
VLLQCSISTGNARPEGPATRASLLLRWRQFVAVYAAVVYGFARKRGLHDADAADLVIGRAMRLRIGVQPCHARYSIDAAPFSNSLDINTIVFTSALIRMVISATGGLWRRAAPASLSNIWPDVVTFIAYFCGAALAGMLVSHPLATLIWFPTAAVLVALGFSELAGKEGST